MSSLAALKPVVHEASFALRLKMSTQPASLGRSSTIACDFTRGPVSFGGNLRQLGFGLSMYDGPLIAFLTTNFAEVYSPLAVTLVNGAGAPLGKRDVSKLQSSPDMPTVQAMLVVVEYRLVRSPSQPEVSQTSFPCDQR